MHWEDEGYSRNDKDGNPVSLVSYRPANRALGVDKLG